MAENITQFPKTLILKKRGIEIKRDHGTAYNSYEKLQVKNSGYGKRAQTDMERVCCKRNFRY
jgi:hypothetical protein